MENYRLLVWFPHFLFRTKAFVNKYYLFFGFGKCSGRIAVWWYNVVRIRHLMSIWIHVIFSGFQLKSTYTTYRFVKKKSVAAGFFFHLYAWVDLVLVFLGEGCLLKQWKISVDQIKVRKSSNSISFITLLWVYNTSEILTVLG